VHVLTLLDCLEGGVAINDSLERFPSVTARRSSRSLRRRKIGLSNRFVEKLWSGAGLLTPVAVGGLSWIPDINGNVAG
jgi:hypothetical protein